MNQIETLDAQRELKLRKSTVVKLNVGKVGKLIGNNFNTATVNTSGSTLPQCDMTSFTSLLV